MSENDIQSWPYQIHKPKRATIKKFKMYALDKGISPSELFTQLVDTLDVKDTK